MSYALHFSARFKSKAGHSYFVNIYEDGYVGTSYEIPLADQPVRHEYLTNADNPFEPIIGSQLVVRFDITDYVGDLPDLTATDDLKYYIEFMQDGNMIFRGYLLNDNITLPFTTGRKFLELPFVDGFALLKSIPFKANDEFDSHPNYVRSMNEFITTSFKNIEYPNSPKIGVLLNVFANGMTTKATDLEAEPLSQAYLANRTFIDNNEYKSCYDILVEIATAFGAQIFQAEGIVWIASTVERAKNFGDVVYWDFDGNIVGTENKALKYELKPYTTGTKDLYFINNEQNKVLKKAYNGFRFRFPFNLGNLIPNFQFTDIVSTVPRHWSVDKILGAGSVSSNMDSIGIYNAFQLNISGGASAKMEPNLDPVESNIFASFNVKFRISLEYQSVSASPSKPLGYIALIVNRDIAPSNVESWLFNNNSGWDLAPNPASPYTTIDAPQALCPVIPLPNDQVQTFTIETPFVPISGPGRIFFSINTNDTDFESSWKITNVSLEPIIQEEERILSFEGTSKAFVLEKEITIGAEGDPLTADLAIFNGGVYDFQGEPYTSWNYSLTGASSFSSLFNFVTEAHVMSLKSARIQVEGAVSNLVGEIKGVVSNDCLPTNIIVNSLNNFNGTTSYTFTFTPPVSNDVTALTIQARVVGSLDWSGAQSFTGGISSPRSFTINNNSYEFRIISIGGSCQNQTTETFTVALPSTAASLKPFSYLCHVEMQDSPTAYYSIDETIYLPTALDIDFVDDSFSVNLSPIPVWDTRGTGLTEVNQLKLIDNGRNRF